MDKKNLQIMEIMAQNCRIPRTTIAQALQISKDTASYKLKKLEETKFISQYVLFIDARQLGFTRYHILLRFDAGVRDKERIYTNIKNHPFVMWMNTFIGTYDMQIIVDARDGFHLNTIKEELFTLCDHHIKGYQILTHLYDLEFTQMNPILDLHTTIQKKLDHSFSSLFTTKNFPVKPYFKRHTLKKTEIEILNCLADDPKKTLTDIGKGLHIDRSTIKKKIIELIQRKIILNFGGIPNLSQLGFVTYYFLVRLKQNIPHNILQKPFQKLQNIFYAGRMIGDYDMILYLNARDPKELNESIELFKSEIEANIIHYELLVQDKVHCWRQFTKGIYHYLKNEGVHHEHKQGNTR